MRLSATPKIEAKNSLLFPVIFVLGPIFEFGPHKKAQNQIFIFLSSKMIGKIEKMKTIRDSLKMVKILNVLPKKELFENQASKTK